MRILALLVILICSHFSYAEAVPTFATWANEFRTGTMQPILEYYYAESTSPAEKAALKKQYQEQADMSVPVFGVSGNFLKFQGLKFPMEFFSNQSGYGFKIKSKTWKYDSARSAVENYSSLQRTIDAVMIVSSAPGFSLFPYAFAEKQDVSTTFAQIAMFLGGGFVCIGPKLVPGWVKLPACVIAAWGGGKVLVNGAFADEVMKCSPRGDSPHRDIEVKVDGAYKKMTLYFDAKGELTKVYDGKGKQEFPNSFTRIVLGFADNVCEDPQKLADLNRKAKEINLELRGSSASVPAKSDGAGAN